MAPRKSLEAWWTVMAERPSVKKTAPSIGQA
jgi:hypothetical protein